MSLASIRQRDPAAAWAIARTLPLEGGLVDNPADPGGVTDHGVSLRYALQEVQTHPDTVRWFDMDHDGHVDRKDIIGLTPDAAADIYFECWWLTGWYGKLKPALVAWKCFDIAVNTGPHRAAILLQKALCAVGEKVNVDAVIGAHTIDAVAYQAKLDQGLSLANALREVQAEFYRSLARNNPVLGRFLKGWLSRAAA